MSENNKLEELLQEFEQVERKKEEAPKPAEPVKDDALNHTIREFVTLGTPACGLLCTVLGVVCAALLLTVGFWKTVMLAVFGAAGLFVGGVKDKVQWIKNLMNRIVPPTR